MAASSSHGAGDDLVEAAAAALEANSDLQTFFEWAEARGSGNMVLLCALAHGRTMFPTRAPPRRPSPLMKHSDNTASSFSLV